MGKIIKEDALENSAQPSKKKIIKRVQRDKKQDEGVIDYSSIYNNFYEIFAGMQIDPKNFDLNYAVRESRNLYASFINLLDTNAVVMKQKYKFDKAPLEYGYKDYGIFPGYELKNIAKDIEDMEIRTHNGELTRKQVLIEAAVEQHQ